MSVVSFIVIAIALGISSMLLMRRCTEAAPVQLSAGLLISFTVAIVHAALFCLGILLGNYLRFEMPDDPEAFSRANSFVLLGLSIIVSIKMMWPYMGRKTQPMAYDLNAGTLRVLLFTIATGINGFLLGIGVGFVTPLGGHFHGAFWPLLVAVFLLSYLGIMYGRQHVKLRPRRWMAVSAVIIIVTVIAAVVNAG